MSTVEIVQLPEEPLSPGPQRLPQSCVHCGTPFATGQNAGAGSQFCCRGCEFVYGILHKSGLEHFYDLKPDQITTRPATLDENRVTLQLFDSGEFEAEYVKTLSGTVSEVALEIEGIHCAACIWLLERLDRVVPGVLEARADFSTRTLTVRYTTGAVRPLAIAEGVLSLGYRPYPMKHGQPRDDAHRMRDRSMLLRLGVAAASASNTMLFSVSLYEGAFTGIDESFASLFRWVSLLVAIPAVVYSALPFYRTAIGSLKVRSLHIDVPISAGILLGFFGSTWNTVYGHPAVYFDSLTALIFLLLIGRWLQDLAVMKATLAARTAPSLLPRLGRLVSEGTAKVVEAASIQPSQVLRVEELEAFPVDGTVVSGFALVDVSVLTGEPVPRPVAPGDLVYGGSRAVQGSVDLRASHSQHDSLIGRLIDEAQRSRSSGSSLLELTSRLSRYFVAAILVLSVVTGAYWAAYGLPAHEIGQRVLAILVVSCPCALGLAVPLTVSAAVGKAQSRGILILRPGVIEELAQAKQYFFDKTGTLTVGSPAVVEAWGWDRDGALCRISDLDASARNTLANALQALERNSSHPYALALYRYGSELSPRDAGNTEKGWDSSKGSTFEDVEHLLGHGVQGTDQTGRTWSLGALKWVQATLDPAASGKIPTPVIDKWLKAAVTPVLLAADEQPIALFGIVDEIRPGIRELLVSLIKGGKKVTVLSGDREESVSAFAKTLAIPGLRAHGGLSPADKCTFVEAALADSGAVVFGDGLNDAAALTKATVGVAVRGGAQACLRAGDVTIIDTSATAFESLIRGAARAYHTIRLNLWISLAYNAVGIVAAFFGIIGPLGAALLMPLSSLTVTGLSAFSRSVE